MREHNWITVLQKVSWALFLLALPITNFPYFPGSFGGKTLIRPLSVYPLIALVILVTLPRLFRRSLPKTFLPLFAFVVVALMSSLLALSFGSEVHQGVTMASRILRNIITLVIGVAIYLTVVLYAETWEDLKTSLRWIYAGFSIAMLWGSIQAVYVIHYSPKYFKFINQLQSYISTRKLFPTRISGLTYEPKWFAEQIGFLLLPWLIASVLSRRSLFKWRFRWITVEWILLVWGVIILIFTFSRTGILILGLVTFVSFLYFKPYSKSKKDNPATERLIPRWKNWVLAILAVAILFSLVIFIGYQNRYFSRLWRYWTDDQPANKTYFEYIALRQRVAYWTTAYRMFEAYPVLGVGLGNYAFHFNDMLPDQSWNRLPEIIRQITPVEGRDRLITPKNLYARLLAETGLVGTVTFTSFSLAVLGCVLFLWFSPTREQKYWGGAGLLGVLTYLVVMFSFDSFALPNMWVVFGLITAAAHIMISLPNSSE